MTQRALAVRTSLASLVVGPRLESQYLVGSASPLGHSISSHSSGQGSLRSVSPCAGRTRRAAKRDASSPRLPSRQLTRRQAEAGRLVANSRVETGLWSPLQPRAGGRGPP